MALTRTFDSIRLSKVETEIIFSAVPRDAWKIDISETTHLQSFSPNLSTMQPLERKQTKFQNGIARAQLLLKRDLPWLSGYPVGIEVCERSGKRRVRWVSTIKFQLGRPSVWTIDRDGLRRAQMAVTQLLQHSPRALSKLVNDVDDWSARIHLLLWLLKDTIHGESPITSDEVLQSGVLPKRWTDGVVQLKTAQPSLASLLDAVTFSSLSDHQSCRIDQIEWLTQHSDLLCDLVERNVENALELPIIFLSFRKGMSPRLLRSIIRCLTDPVLEQCHWERMDRVFSQLNKALKNAINQNEYSMPEPSGNDGLGETVRQALYRTLALQPKQRQSVFKLLEQLLSPVLLDRIAEVQRQFPNEEHRLCRFLQRIKSGYVQIPSTKAGRKNWLENAPKAPEFDYGSINTAEAIGKLLKRLPTTPDANEQSWTRFLASFQPEHASLGVRLLNKWLGKYYGVANRKKETAFILKPLASLLHRRGIASSLRKNWHDYIDSNNTKYEFVADTCYEVNGDPKIAKRTVALLEETVYQLKVNAGPQLMASLVEFVKATSDDTLSSLIVKELANRPDNTYDATAIGIAVQFNDSPIQIADMLMQLGETHDLDRMKKELKLLASDPELRRIIAERIAEGKIGSLMEMINTVSILSDLNRPLPKREIISQSFDWCVRYPDVFWPALRSLSESSPEAERIAEKVLGKFFPSHDAIQQQINVLRSKIEQTDLELLDRNDRLSTKDNIAWLRRRLDNLQTRITRSGSVSTKRRTTLIEKLHQRADGEKLQRFTLKCRHLAARELSERWGVQQLPNDLFSPPLDRAIGEINRLSKPMRKLGIRLLFGSHGRTTHGFDNEPENIAFAKRMHAIGVNMHPWQSDQFSETAKMADGTTYELSFTRNIVDFLLMGFHFNTCLSPNSFNFFSTIANAVDSNKRVVYGKTAAGKVIGRCLFALNEAGEILTYHRYSHDAKDSFAAAIDRFASRLANEMQTSIGNGGRVAKLVANDWYDDGPVDNASDWLAEGGVINDLIERSKEHQLLPNLIDAVGEISIRRKIVEIATNSKLNDRTIFLTDLLERFGRGMSFRQCFIVAVNVDSVNVRERLLSQMRWSEIIRFVRRNQCHECDVFHGIAAYDRVFRVLTQYHPSLGLRSIRAARPCSIKDDLKDPSRTRRTALIEAHSHLGRKSLAEKLAKS